MVSVVIGRFRELRTQKATAADQGLRQGKSQQKRPLSQDTGVGWAQRKASVKAQKLKSLVSLGPEEASVAGQGE